MSDLQLTPATIGVLAALNDRGEATGAQISSASGLATGTVYPLLKRLESGGWVSSRQESGDPATLGRPLRKFYTIARPEDVHQAANNLARILQLLCE